MGLKNKKKIAIGLALSIIVYFVFVYFFVDKKPKNVEISINNQTIFAKVADTEHKRSMGLSYTKKIDENAGMLFVFEDSATRHFWMRDMLFDIDIIWLDAEKKVIGFFENVSRDTYNSKNPELSKIYHSPDNTKYVLEVNSGLIEKYKIHVGDILNFEY